MILFDNTEVAFRKSSDGDLRRAYWLFRMIGSPGLVKFGKWMTNFALKIRMPLRWIIKPTIFRQFCGGESIKESLKASKKLADRNVKTILDYSIEGKTDEKDLDATMHEVVGTIKEAQSNDDIPFAVFKVTGITTFDVLEKANGGIDKLSESDLIGYNKLVERLEFICAEAHKASVPIFIDAEESWIQDAIDQLAYEMSLKFNQNRAIVYNTIQLYRHDRLAFLRTEIDRAKKEKFFLGVKLVRGAYMEKERNRAEEKEYPSPIQPNKEATDRDFNAALELVITEIDHVSFCAGTHNEESSLHLADLMSKNNISSDDPRAYFAQLLGMSDHISFNLSNEGFMVAKYVPYGPIREVLPYLIRRAEENTSVAGQTSRELSLIIKERKRRKKK
ncbi:proline dehydrogenase family protein [Crocinitomicaceae bacterium]|nr:proline dehydrogenase family protein [Crocinitomicaceae bacterium]MDB3906866.1 proline dehydrogenase family protein [Crocinitomicaceae bacterium]